MTAFHCAAAALIVFAMSLIAVQVIDPASRWVKGLREIRLYAGIFFLFALAFYLIGNSLSVRSASPETISSVLGLEKQIIWLQSVAKPLLKLGFWVQISVLVLIAMLALAGATTTSARFARVFGRYGKISKLAIVLLFCLSSFSFFQSRLAAETGDIVAQLKSKTDEVFELNRRAIEKVEAAVAERVIAEVVDSQDLSDAYRPIVTFWQVRDEWKRENGRSDRFLPGGPNGGSTPPTAPRNGSGGPSEARRSVEAISATFDGRYDKLKASLAASSTSVRPVNSPQASVAIKAADFGPSGASVKSSETLAAAAVAVKSAPLPKVNTAGSEELYAVVKKGLEKAYSETLEPPVKAMLALEGTGVSDELVGLLADPILLDPLKDMVVKATNRIVARALGGEKLETVIQEFLDRTSDRRAVWRQAIGVRLAKLRERAQTLKNQFVAGVKDDRNVVAPLLIQRADVMRGEIVEGARAFRIKRGALDTIVTATVDDLVRKLEKTEPVSDRLEQLNNLLAIVKRLPADTGPAFADLQAIEGKVLNSQRLAAAVSAEASRIVREDRSTQWGRVRGILTDAIKNEELKLGKKQIAEWNRIWQRWTREEGALARKLVLQSPDVSRPHTAFDAEFTKLLKQDGELSAIWGFAAKSFIAPDAKEEFYRVQIVEYDSIEKVRRGRDLNFIIKASVLDTAVEKGRASDLADAIQKWKSGRLDDLIDLKTIAQMIRDRGMIPAFGLEYYLVSSKTGTKKEASDIYRAKSFGQAVAEYCS
jgi:hypothetical protein